MYDIVILVIFISRPETCGHRLSHCWHHQGCSRDGAGHRWIPGPLERHGRPQREPRPGGERGGPQSSGKVRQEVHFI